MKAEILYYKKNSDSDYQLFNDSFLDGLSDCLVLINANSSEKQYVQNEAFKSLSKNHFDEAFVYEFLWKKIDL